MLIMKVTRYDKNGIVTTEKYRFSGTREQMLEIERLYELAEDNFIDQSENWR